MRLIHAVRELNAEYDAGIRTIAIHTDPDRRAMFVREADEAVSLGQPMFLDEDGERKISYLNYQALEQLLRAAKADAVWPGWGFVAESPDFVDRLREAEIVFLGPTASAMRSLGDKITSKPAAEEASVPVAPWSGGELKDAAEERSE